MKVRWTGWVGLLVGWLLVGCNTPAPTAVTVTLVAGPTATAVVALPTITTAPETKTADADVTFVRAVANGDSWTFHVTVSHPDTGWEDYADGWDVVLPDGTVLKPDPASPFTRLLLHPHETEQPFTRSQRGLIIPPDVTAVSVRAHDLVDGWGGQEVVVDLTLDEGENFMVERPNQ